MQTQINLKMPPKLFAAARKHARDFGYRNVQEVIYESVREKVFRQEYDESFTEKEINLIDKIIDASIRKGKLVGEKELRAALKE